MVVNRRMNFLIDVLLRIVQDCFFKIALKQRLQTINKQEIKEANRHKKGLDIKHEDVMVCNIMSHFLEFLWI